MTLVVTGLLVAIGAFSYTALVAGAQDRAAQIALGDIARHAVASLRMTQGATGFVETAADASAPLGKPATVQISGRSVTFGINVDSTGPNVVSVAVADSTSTVAYRYGDTIGMAVRSLSGRCVYGLADRAAQVTSWVDAPAATCNAWGALSARGINQAFSGNGDGVNLTNPSAPAPSTPPPPAAPANDACPAATLLPQATSDLGTTVVAGTNVGATDDTGGSTSVWFRHFAPVISYTTIDVVNPTSAVLAGTRTISVYRGTNGSGPAGTGVSTCSPLTLVDSSTGIRPGVSFRTTSGNDNYFVVITSTAADAADFRLEARRHDSQPRADLFSSAEQVSVNPSQSTTQDLGFSSMFASNEAGETPDSWSTVWHHVMTFYAAAGNKPTYTFQVIGPSNGLQAPSDVVVEVYADTATVTSPGAPLATAQGPMGTSVTWTSPGGQGVNFYVRVRSLTGQSSGDYRVVLTRGVQ